jgi:hypothetical protein
VNRSPIVRWTVGDVSESGFQALQLSIRGAHRLIGPDARYVVCVNSVPVDRARALAGPVPEHVEWRAVTRDELAPFIRPHLDGGLAEGVGWKFAPFRLDPDRPELALDNDCILWDLPEALRLWLDAGGGVRVIAEDVRACFGQFASLCGDEPRNSGIRALPAGFDLEGRMRRVLTQVPAVMSSELDEQGLQVAAVSADGPPAVVRVSEVSICSPFPPHLPHLGACGAHFVGVNARSLPWSYEGRPGVEYIQEHWTRWRPEVARRVGESEV